MKKKEKKNKISYRYYTIAVPETEEFKDLIEVLDNFPHRGRNMALTAVIVSHLEELKRLSEAFSKDYRRQILKMLVASIAGEPRGVSGERHADERSDVGSSVPAEITSRRGIGEDVEASEEEQKRKPVEPEPAVDEERKPATGGRGGVEALDAERVEPDDVLSADESDVAVEAGGVEELEPESVTDEVEETSVGDGYGDGEDDYPAKEEAVEATAESDVETGPEGSGDSTVESAPEDKADGKPSEKDPALEVLKGFISVV